MQKYIDLWKDGLVLLVKVSILFYAIRIIFMFSIFPIAILLGVFGIDSDVVAYSIVAVLGLLFLPPLTVILAEYLKLTKEKPNKFGHDFSK